MMQKYKAKKEVVEQVTINLNKAQNSGNKGNLGEISSIFDDSINLPSSKIEKSNHNGCVLKDYYINGHHQRHWVKMGEDLGDAADTYVISEKDKEDIKSLREKYLSSMKDTFNTVFINKRINMKAHFSKNSATKVFSDKAIRKTLINGFTPKDHFETAMNLQKIFENAEYVGGFPDKNDDVNVIAMHRFQQEISLSTGKKAVAYMTVKESKVNGNKFYTIEVMLKKYPLQISKGLNLQRLETSETSTISCRPLNTFILSKSQNKSSTINKSLTYSGYKLQGRTKLYGMDISIENKKGTYRKGTDSDGHNWKCLMHYDYGYIRGTVGTDGDHLDTYVGPYKEAQKVYVIHQNNPVTHKYDEDKCMLCFESADAAKKAYMKQYDRPGFFGSMDILTIDEFKSYVFSKQGKRIHKSFDITVTDITDDNKKYKLEQVQKSLDAIANNKPFVIKHIAAEKGSKKYDDIVLRITDFDRNKIEKAVHKIALTLDTELPAKGEAFNFKSQEELTNRFVTELTKKSNMVYSFLIDYFDLPEIRIVTKGKLKYEGKVLYNPETGKPIDTKDWKNFVDALEKFLNRNYDGIGKKIVLNAETLGRILAKLSKTHSLEAIKKMQLKELEINHRKFDWISETAQNMKDVFGESVSRDRAARIQVAIDSAAVKVTKVTDNMRNDIQQIIIDGVKNKESKSQVSQKLFDKCVGLNRDFQRIADTEIQNTVNNAYIKEEVYNTKEGEKVYFKRYEILDDNTCKKCKKIKGAIALWSDVALGSEKIVDPYSDYAIWEGKESGELPMGTMHPYCYSDDTEVMTNDGWKLFKDVLDDDLIMAINPDNHEVDFIPFVKRVTYEYKGEMIHFPGRNFDLLVTPNHNMLIEERKNKKWHGISADELIKKYNYSIPRARGIWKGNNPDKIKIGCVDYSYIQYIKLWAWYLSEGSGRKKSDNAYEIKLAQKDINKILNDIPEFEPRFDKGKEALYCTGKIAEEFEQMFGIYAADKYIPDFIKNSSAECIREFLISFNLGDGSKRNRDDIKNNSLGIKKSKEMLVRTSSKRMADDLCELIIKAGWIPSVSLIKQKGKKINFRSGIYEINTDCYVINICKSKNKVYSNNVIPGHPDNHLPYKLDYSGMVYDVELEKWHYLLVKRNGKCAWSGNCRGSWYRYYPEVDKDNK